MGHDLGEKGYWKTNEPQPEWLLTHKLGGRGKCRFCGKMENNVAYHEAKECSVLASGYCPHCGAPGVTRERKPNGDDRCENGHVYPSKSAVKEAGHGEPKKG